VQSRGGEREEKQYSYRVLYKRNNKILDNTTQRRRTIYEVDAGRGHTTAFFIVSIAYTAFSFCTSLSAFHLFSSSHSYVYTKSHYF
jgi:hypothetical protein